ncbi:AraC family transcriptional regulator [Mucilaginibacter sp. PPCGB 2223]|uniref:helix-turn-helix domain-containing protein n=1 Tax=Mucilaginibacter sp. PPCGB 2223 TaxID=1886027 RepID=UPI0008256359|nr:AraC family transcriptional regulator [Mucilaginibacter sp. PPCGB 2223]OCX53728.1 AraC family transcriptional regulator [Mucilaginibacter sp. PPCGB 2223]
MEVAEVFVSCKKEVHYSRELILSQPALVRVISGEMRIMAADRSFRFFAGDTALLPRDQLARMSKLPLNDEPCVAISIVFCKDRLAPYYQNIQPLAPRSQEPVIFADHPLLKSLFNSLDPYFELADSLPADIAAFKVEEAIRVLRAVNPAADGLLGYFEKPGKLDLANFMEHNFRFNLPLEKFGYLTGRSLTTFKKDFRMAFNSSPGRWLTRKRLELAHYQLSEQHRKPSEVYLDTGFEDLSHFSFAFKKQYGYSPGQISSMPHD